MNFTWTDERIAALKKCVLDDWSSGRAARLLGVTRNCVIGKANRMGLRFGSFLRQNQLPQGNGGGKGKPRVRKVRPRPPVNLTEIFPYVEPKQQNQFIGKQLLDLKAGECLFPQGTEVPYLFCGAPVKDESSWCAYHHKICITKTTYEPKKLYVPARSKR